MYIFTLLPQYKQPFSKSDIKKSPCTLYANGWVLVGLGVTLIDMKPNPRTSPFDIIVLNVFYKLVV